MTITFAGAKEGKAQGNIVVALGVHTLDIPANTFIHPAIVPNQEAARQGNMIKWKISVTENFSPIVRMQKVLEAHMLQ